VIESRNQNLKRLPPEGRATGGDHLDQAGRSLSVWAADASMAPRLNRHGYIRPPAHAPNRPLA